MKENKENKTYIIKWLKTHNIKCSYENGQFKGKHKDILRLEELLRNQETKLQLPCRKYFFKDINKEGLKEIEKFVKENNKKWNINKLNNSVLGPITDKQEIYESSK